MAAVDIVPAPGESFEQTMLSASPDLLREMVRAFAQKMMDAEVEVACGAGYGEVSPARVNSRNGYRARGLQPPAIAPDTASAVTSLPEKPSHPLGRAG